MSRLLFSLAVFGAFSASIDAQFFFNQGFNFFNPQQFQRPFQQLFQPPTTPAPQTTTLEFIPDPDKEQGNFPMPNPANWPAGPDWNDPRNNAEQQLGWGGNGLIGTTSTRPPIAVITTTRPPPTTTTNSLLRSPTTVAQTVTNQASPAPFKKGPTKKRNSPKRSSLTPTPRPAKPKAPVKRTAAGKSRTMTSARISH